MKKILIILSAIILFQYPVFADSLKGVWVSTVANLDYPAKPTTDPDILKHEADNIISNCRELGFNAIFLQVRPSGDALYKTELYPWSHYLTGTQGLAPDNGFDPLAYWCDIAHKNNIELHAWINPYRISTSPIALAPDNIARTHPEYTKKYKNGTYLDPGIPEVREYVIKAAAELASKYDIDGIHLDDYFYPGKDFPDSDTYSRYGNGMTLEDWRRSNTYTLIKEMGEAVHKENKRLRFGVSPCGIWANKGSMENGSDTRGASAYFDMYADTLRWARENIIDYIAPQIYWYNGYAPADYGIISKWWCDSLKGCATDLYIGLADYRMDEFGSDSTSAWYNGNEIIKQMRMNKSNEAIKGEIHFRYSSVINHATLYEKIKNEYKEKSFTLYIYYDRTGKVIFAKKDTAFLASRCRASAPENAAYARAFFENKSGRLKRETVVCK